MSDLTVQKRKQMFFDLLRIRMVEHAIVNEYHKQEMRCPTHFSIGQEATAVGVCANLSRHDYVMSTHRPHAHYLAKGGSLKKFIAELYGKKTGSAGGRGGSMHLIDLNCGFLGCVPIVGSTIPIAVGTSFSIKQLKEDRISVVFLGDAATEEGVFYESLNFAKLHNLPVLFVCENNSYSVNTPYELRRPRGQKISDIVASFGLAVIETDGQDCDVVYGKTEELVKDVRSGKGPAFIELHTFLSIEHCGPHWDEKSRPSDFVNHWLQRDPVDLHEKKLLGEKVINEQEVSAMKLKIQAEIQEAFVFAQTSEFPPATHLTKHIFKEEYHG